MAAWSYLNELFPVHYSEGKEMESFYRVQDSKGIGPYQNDDNSYMMYKHTDRDRHPSPFDGNYVMKSEELCGFRNMRDLFRWFGGYLPILLKEDYSVVKATGEIKYEDDCQVVFKPVK